MKKLHVVLLAGAPALAQGFSPTLPFGVPKSARRGPAAPNAAQAQRNYYNPSNPNSYYRYSNPYRFYTGGAGYGAGAPLPNSNSTPSRNLDSNTLPSYQNSDKKDNTPPGY